jgi:hypothetical protein
MQPKSQRDDRRGWYRHLFCVFLFCLVPSESWAIGKVGVGSGLPYGTPLLGVGLELDLGKFVAALGGIGVGNYEAPWAVGVRLSLARPGKKWRPHITGMHWAEGNGVYAGVDHDVGKPGGLVLTYGIGFGDVNLEARVGGMIGVGYRF